MTALVTGGRGTLGSAVVAELLRRRQRVKVLTRRPGAIAGAEVCLGDLVSGSGLAHAMTGISTLIHCAHDPASPQRHTDGMANLIHSAREAGVRHIVLISITGISGATSAYYRAKLDDEQRVLECGIPATILRAAQFFELIDRLLTQAHDGAHVLVPRGVMLRPVAATSVAKRLVDVSLAPAAGRVRAVAGPETTDLETLAKHWIAARATEGTVRTANEDSPLTAVLRTLTPEPADPLGPDWRSWLVQSK